MTEGQGSLLTTECTSLTPVPHMVGKQPFSFSFSKGGKPLVTYTTREIGNWIHRVLGGLKLHGGFRHFMRDAPFQWMRDL